MKNKLFRRKDVQRRCVRYLKKHPCKMGTLSTHLGIPLSVILYAVSEMSCIYEEDDGTLKVSGLGREL